MSSSNRLSPPKPNRPSFFHSISSSSSINDFTHELSQSISPRKDKPRLYLALFARGGSNLSSSSYSSSLTCDSYHWAILVGPKEASRDEPGTCHQIVHANSGMNSSNAPTAAFYEESQISNQSQAQSQALLARITLAKVTDEKRVRSLLQSLQSTSPPSSNHSSHSDSEYDTDDIHTTYTCLTWVRSAYKLLTTDTRCLRGYIGPQDWAEVEEVARLYVKKKRRQGRFGGQNVLDVYRTWKDDEIPTWNFWENRETTY